MLRPHRTPATLGRDTTHRLVGAAWQQGRLGESRSALAWHAPTGLFGPLIVASGIAIMFDVTDRGSTLQGIATIPEFFWELSLGIYRIAKGFRSSSPLLAADETVRVPESPSAQREGVEDRSPEFTLTRSSVRTP